jgi:hypothetical protein
MANALPYVVCWLSSVTVGKVLYSHLAYPTKYLGLLVSPFTVVLSSSVLTPTRFWPASGLEGLQGERY